LCTLFRTSVSTSTCTRINLLSYDPAGV
jgi:hypothetical protein